MCWVCDVHNSYWGVIRKTVLNMFWKIDTLCLFRSSHRRCSVTKGVLRNFAKFTRKRLCQSHSGNVPQDSGDYSRGFREMLLKILGNAREDSGECWRRFRGMLLKTPGNVIKDSGDCSSGFRGMFKKIPGNLNFDLFLEIVIVFIKYCFLSNIFLLLKYFFLSLFFLCWGKRVITVGRDRGIKKL